MVFSILIPVFNNYPLFCDAAHSVSAQSFRDFETIICDQSNDGTSELIEAECKRRGFVYQKAEEPSLFKARRALIRASRGDYLIWLDSDDRLKPNALATLWVMICEYDRPDLCFYAWSIIDEAGETTNPYVFVNAQGLGVELISGDEFIKRMLFSSEYNDLWNKCFSKRVYDECPTDSINEISMAEDFIRVQELVKSCKKIAITDATLYEYRINQNSMTHVFKPKYWLDYAFYFNTSFRLFSEFFSEKEEQLKNTFLDFKLLELFNFVVFASDSRKNFIGEEAVVFRRQPFFEELRSRLSIAGKTLTPKRRYVLKRFFKKEFFFLSLAKWLRKKKRPRR